MVEVMVERGVSKGDCVQKIVDKYGPYFNILRERRYRTSGFLGFGARDQVEVEFYLSPRQSLGVALQGGGPAMPVAVPDVQPVRGRSAGRPAVLPRDDTTLDFEEAKKRVLAAAGKNPEQVFRQVQEEEGREETQQLILDQLKEIREIQQRIESAKKPAGDHPAMIRIAQMLRQNDFGERYISNILERARKELALDILEDFDAVQDRFVEWIGESVKIFNVPDKPGNQMYARNGRIMVLVGPTGVGKTTTIAKLAAVYGIGNSGRRPLSVRIITIDAFKIGAEDQIMKFGAIMEIPVSKIDNRRDLRREIDLYREETDLILIDTIGRSPGDSAKLGEMKELLDACGSKAEIHLVLSASTKTSDIEHILRQFEPFNYQAVLLTKLDETRHVGNVISALTEKDKPVSYITDGQDVHKYIKKANVVWFLTNLEEFRVDRERMEKCFPAGEAEQFQWSEPFSKLG